MSDLIERAKEALEGATEGPWSYRPKKYDDWGYVRGAPDGDGWGAFICQAKAPTTEEEENAARKNGVDPWEVNARLIALAPDLARALIREREAADRLAEILDAAITEHDTANYGYDEENRWTMGEWFTEEDRAALAAYRAAQKETDDE